MPHIATIRIVSPAGAIDRAIIDRGAETLHRWGFDTAIAAHATARYGRYAGTPEERAQDLIDAIADPDADLIWCTRGGYGCMQILDKIPTDLIRSHPKWLIGYSDVTALHALWQKAGVASLHAPMMKHLGESPLHPSSLALKQLLLSEPTPRRDAAPAPIAFAPDPLNRTGEASGTLIGGNLAVLSGLHGTPYDMDYRDAILMVEDIGESPYKIDRMFQTLRLAGIFEQIRGLVVGRFTDCEEDPLMPAGIMQNIHTLLMPYRMPVAFRAPVGHVEDNFPLIEGGHYRLIVTPEGVEMR